MKNNGKDYYEAPAILVLEVKSDSCLLQMSQEDYHFGGLDEIV